MNCGETTVDMSDYGTMVKRKRSKLKHRGRHEKNSVLDQYESQEYFVGSRDYVVEGGMNMSNEHDRRDLKYWTKRRQHERQRDFRSVTVDDRNTKQERSSAEIYASQSPQFHQEKTKHHPSLRETFEEDWNKSLEDWNEDWNESFSGLGTQQNQLKQDRVNQYHREQGPSRKRRRSPSISPTWGSPTAIEDVSSDSSDCEPGPVSGEICCNNIHSNRCQGTVTNETITSERTRTFSREYDKHGGPTSASEYTYGRSQRDCTKHERVNDTYLSVSTQVHNIRSAVDRFHTKDIFTMPISLRSFGDFRTRQMFIAEALAELVSLKNEMGRALQGVRMSDFRSRLYSQGIEFESHESYKEIMSSLRSNFLITHEGMIEPRTDIKICDHYTQNPRLKDCDCHDLHICKFFLVGRCFSDKSCKFSHNISHPHNRDVLKHHFLHKMRPEYIGEVVSYVHNRNVTTSPTVCKFYNNEGGCMQQQHCQHLHVCLHFVKSTCKFGKQCKRDHDFLSPQSENILLKYGLLEYQKNHEVLFKLIGKCLQNGMIVTKKFLHKKIMTEDHFVDGLPSTSKDNLQETAHSETRERYLYVLPIDTENAKIHKKSRKMKVKKGKKRRKRNDYTEEFSSDDDTGRTWKTADRFGSGNNSRDLHTSYEVDQENSDQDTLACSAMESHIFSTCLERKYGSTVKPKTLPDDLTKQLYGVINNVHEKTCGGTKNKLLDKFSKRSDGLENVNTEEISKTTLQKHPNDEGTFTRQREQQESAEEGEIVDDTPADNRQLVNYSHSSREKSDKGRATLALTYSTTKSDLGCSAE